MRIVTDTDDISPESLYPVKRRYFSLFFMGNPSDLSLFTSELCNHLPIDWPIIIFDSKISHVSLSSMAKIPQMAAISNAAILWTSSDSDSDFSLNPYFWSAYIGRFVSSNKKCLFGSSVPTAYRPISKIVGHDKWYQELKSLCADLSLIIKNELLEHVTIESTIHVKNGVR